MVKKIFFSFLMIFLSVSCTKNEAPTPNDEGLDKGHDNPVKVEIFSTEVQKNGDTFERTNLVQKMTYSVDGVVGLVVEGEAFRWKAGKHYLFELVYYNAQGQRMNHEFVSREMAPIHQHFFRMDKKRAVEMDEYLSYQYQDTDPETGYLGQPNVNLRLRSWDSKNPTGIDPIGLKGIFSVKKGGISFDMKVTLAHFLGADRGFTKLDEGQEKKYNELPSVNFFASDLDVAVKVEILN